MAGAAVEARERLERQYEDMHVAMDHALAALRIESLPALAPRGAGPTSAVDSWRVLTDLFDSRRLKLQQREDKRRRKELKKQQKEAEVKAAKARAKAAREEEDKARKKQLKKTQGKPVTPRGSSPRNGTAGNSFLAPDPATSVLSKLREQAGLASLLPGTNKYAALLKWVETDQGKNLPLPRELVALVERIRSRESKRAEAKKLASQKKAKKPIKEETLDDRLRAERKKKLLEVARPRKASSASRKRRIVDDEEEDGKEESSDEAEYADGYSDSGDDDEAEFEASMSPPKETKKPPKRNGTTSSTPVQAAALSAKEQLQRVVAKMKEEELLSKSSSATYLTYENSSESAASKYRGSSPGDAIVLDESDGEEDDESEAEYDTANKANAAGEDAEEADNGDAEGDESSSTDEDQDLFDLNEEDVYVVESILKVKEGRTITTNNGKRRKEADLYLVKWDGYDELTWEPESNIPQRLIDFFRDRERAKRACLYQIDQFVERKVVDNVTTGTKEVIYLIQWINQSQAVWEVRSTLPEKTAIWLDKVAGAGGEAQKRRIKIYSSGGK